MRVFDAQATRAGLPLGPLVEALRAMFTDGCEVPLRHTHVLHDADGGVAGTVLIMPAWRPGHRLGIKTVNVFPHNTRQGLPGLHAVYTLFDAGTGRPLAQIDGDQLTTRRTVAASALAARYLARDDAVRLLVVGTGRVARLVPEAMRTQRASIEEVVVWGRRPEAAQALAAAWQAEGLAASVATDLEAAVRQADIVSCATLSTEALIRGDWLKPGAHLDLVGAFAPGMREADGNCLRRGDLWMDTAEAMAKAGDLLQAVAEGCLDPGGERGDLAQLCRGEIEGRQARGQITVFKSVGTALEDLAAAEMLLDGTAP